MPGLRRGRRPPSTRSDNSTTNTDNDTVTCDDGSAVHGRDTVAGEGGAVAPAGGRFGRHSTTVTRTASTFAGDSGAATCVGGTFAPGGGAATRTASTFGRDSGRATCAGGTFARGSGRAARDSGMVTVEAAVALTAFVAVLALALGAISAAIGQLRCTDAAREAARLAARGEPARATAAAERIAPSDAAVTIDTNGEEITVTVESKPVGGLIPGIELRAEAYAISEPTGPAP